MNPNRGLTLLELLVTLSILTLVLTLGVPSLLSAQRNMQLKGALEVSYFAFQQARSMAISKQQDIRLVLDASSNWCLALTAAEQCNCQLFQDCVIDGVEYAVRGTDFHLIALSEVKFGKQQQAVFDGVRGLAVGNAGSTIFSDGVNRAKLILSNMGRVRICVLDGQVGAYPAC